MTTALDPSSGLKGLTARPAAEEGNWLWLARRLPAFAACGGLQHLESA